MTREAPCAVWMGRSVRAGEVTIAGPFQVRKELGPYPGRDRYCPKNRTPWRGKVFRFGLLRYPSRQIDLAGRGTAGISTTLIGIFFPGKPDRGVS